MPTAFPLTNRTGGLYTQPRQMDGVTGNLPEQLTQQQITDARNWINQQFSESAPDGGWAFNGDFSIQQPGFNDGGRYVLGAAQAMGYDNNALAQILGGSYTPDEISQYAQGVATPAGVNRASVQFAMDNGLITPEEYRRFITLDVPNNIDNQGGATAWTGGVNGGLTVMDGFGPDPAANDVPGGNIGGGPRQERMAQGQGGNPYLQGVFDNISRQYTNTLNEQWLPAIRDNSIASGGLGGARAGVAQGLAIGRAGEGLAGALSNAGMGAWENQQNRDLTRYGIDTNASLTNQGQWMGYQNAQDSLNLQGIGLGAQLMGAGQTMPWYGYNQFGGLLGNAAGNNNSVTGNQSGGGGWGGALWGGLSGLGAAGQMGWFR